MNAPKLSSWPPGRPGRWIGIALVSVATLGGAGGGIASLIGTLRGDERKAVAGELATLSGRQARLEASMEKISERLIELRATVEAREQARRERDEEVRSHLRARTPDPQAALRALDAR